MAFDILCPANIQKPWVQSLLDAIPVKRLAARMMTLLAYLAEEAKHISNQIADSGTESWPIIEQAAHIQWLGSKCWLTLPDTPRYNIYAGFQGRARQRWIESAIEQFVDPERSFAIH
jgi:hypothetical protein